MPCHSFSFTISACFIHKIRYFIILYFFVPVNNSRKILYFLSKRKTHGAGVSEKVGLFRYNGVQLRPIRHMINQARMKKGHDRAVPESKNIEAPRRRSLHGASMLR